MRRTLKVKHSRRVFSKRNVLIALPVSLLLVFTSFYFYHIGSKQQIELTKPKQSLEHPNSLDLDAKLDYGLNYEDEDSSVGEETGGYLERVNATFFMLARNEELDDVLSTLEYVENRFNKNYHYDVVFANDKPFSPSFIQLTSNIVSGNAIYSQIPKEFWGYPEWIDQELAADIREEMDSADVKYGDLESYRHMCRFNSGFFYRLPEMLNYKYYWRIEPNIEFNCDINYDLFKFMHQNNKVYGFALAPFELHTTVLSLWYVVNNFTNTYPDYLAPDNNYEFLTDDNGETFNMCHFWSNFEIGDMDFYRLETYDDFFQYIDYSGGIYYERWGDAPIHTMAVSLFLNKDQVHYVGNTGYYHYPNGQCPRLRDIRDKLNCDCNPEFDQVWSENSCIPLYFEINGLEIPESVKSQEALLKSHKSEEIKNSNPLVNNGGSIYIDD